MKPVIYNDVLAAVSVASAVPISHQKQMIAQLLKDAELAEAYRLRHHSAHPVFGDGSLLASASRYGFAGDTSFQTHAALGAWISVLAALRARLPQPAAQLMQRVTVGSSSRRLGAISSPQSSQ